ncbi:hypothetical protein TNCV_1249521 [Trichonephila clavipes]|nr:hypothetical protein TNCV_1249521 [Trichonephila clavipes]
MPLRKVQGPYDDIKCRKGTWVLLDASRLSHLKRRRDATSVFSLSLGTSLSSRMFMLQSQRKQKYIYIGRQFGTAPQTLDRLQFITADIRRVLVPILLMQGIPRPAFKCDF